MKRREALQRTGLLAGSLAVTPALIGLLQSCQKQERLSWKPVVLDEDQARFVSAMVDTIFIRDTSGRGVARMKIPLPEGHILF